MEKEDQLKLLTILMNYSYWDYFGKFKTPNHEYYYKVKAHFDKYKDHPSIKWFDNASKNWNMDDSATVIFWFDGNPLKQVVPFPLHTTSKIDTNNARELVEKLNQFAEDTEFWKFWNSNRDEYNKMVGGIRNSIPYEKNLKIMEEFYSECKGKFVFILAPLINGASFGPQVEADGKTIAYFISGFDNYENKQPTFDTDYLKMLIFHEFGHSFINPLCEEYRTELLKYEYLKEDFKGSFLDNYNGWFPICHEHIVRTGESILLEKAGYKKHAEENYEKNLQLGFKMLPLFTEKMKYYDSHRVKYDSFKEFYSELLNVFSEYEGQKSDNRIPLK